MKYIYEVYGQRFTNKKDAIKYHHKIYGLTNYQASKTYIYKNNELVKVDKLYPPYIPNKRIWT